MNFNADLLGNARKEGYSDDEIWDFVASQDERFKSARQEGYSLDEVSDYFSSLPQQPAGTSVEQEVSQLGAALKSGIAQPLQAMGVTAETLGMPEVGAALKGAVEQPEGYVPAAQRFMEPQAGEAQLGGFAFQYLPRAIVEQVGQLAGSVASRAAGGVIGGAAGSVVPGAGTAVGAGIGMFTGPALFEAAQIVGPVAQERAKNNGREVPNSEDLAYAWTTAGAGGALNAIGTKYLPGGEKAVGALTKRIAASFLGEGATEGAQALAQQTGETILTEKGLEIKPKAALGEALIGGVSAGGATIVMSPLQKAQVDIEKEADLESRDLSIPVDDPVVRANLDKANILEQENKDSLAIINKFGVESEEGKAAQQTIVDNTDEITKLNETLPTGLSLPITTAEQQQIDLAKQIAAPAPVAEVVTPVAEVPAVEVAPVEAVPVEPTQPVAEAPAITPTPVAETPAVAPAVEVAPTSWIAPEQKLTPQESRALQVANLRGTEKRTGNITFVPEKLMTPQRLQSLRTEQESSGTLKRFPKGGKFIEIKMMGDVTGDPYAKGWAIIDRRPDLNRREWIAQIPSRDERILAGSIANNESEKIVSAIKEGSITQERSNQLVDEAANNQIISSDFANNLKTAISNFTPAVSETITPSNSKKPLLPKKKTKTGATTYDFTPTPALPVEKQVPKETIIANAQKVFEGVPAESIEVVNDPAPEGEYGYLAAYNPNTNKIEINQAHYSPEDNIEDSISHELGHYIYQDPRWKKAFSRLYKRLTKKSRQKLDSFIEQVYSDYEAGEKNEESQIRAFDRFLNDAPDNRNIFQKFIDEILDFVTESLSIFSPYFKSLARNPRRLASNIAVVAAERFKTGEVIEGVDTEVQQEVKRMAAAQPAPEKPIADPATPDEQTQELVQQAQEQESLVDSAVREAGTTVFDVFNRLVNEGKTEDQVAKELGISNYDVRKLKLRADTAILNKMKQNKVKPLAFAPKNPVAEFAEKNLRKYFTKEGWLPKAVFQSWVKRNAALSREQKEAEFAIKDLYAGIREVFGISKMEMITKGLVSVPPEFVQQLNDALAGKIDINTMPEPVREPLTRMRQHIDAMSRQLVDLNVLPDELAAKISANLGVYLTRSYKIFTDKNWINKIPTEKLTAARNFLYQQQLKNDPEATIEMADRELRNMLNDWASDAEGLRKRGGKLGAKDLSVMMERAKVPKVLREVMGENTNVIFNYANTIGKISRFVSDQKFLNEVKAKGTGEFLFTEKDAPKGFNTQIAAEESRTMSPLNGLRTTPEIAKAFEEFGKGYDIRENPGLRLLAWMNAVGKLNLTVGSVLTQMRNLLGQPAFFVFNGHYNWRVIRQEIDAIAKEKGISQEDAKKELVKLAAAQGLVNENAYAGELRTAFQDVGLETFDDIGPDEFTKQFVLTRMYLKGVKSAQELYQKTDEFGKIVGWLNETKRIQRMNKGMDKQTAQSIAAERTRDTYPTYSQSSEALRLFRRQPFFGPFATFFYETFRTSFHNLRYAFEDINGPTPEHKAEGIKRLAGAMTTLSMGAFGINLISKLASGIGDDEEEDVRRMLPPWAKDASLAWMPKSKDGTYNFINVSYINPYNAMTDPFIAMMSGFAKGEKPEEIAAQALGSFLSPFASEQPVTATIADAMRNRTETGKQIYNPQDDITTKTSKIMLHIFGKTFTPGTITRLRERIIPAIQGETVGTRAPAPAKEIAAELTGIRFETLDMKAAFSNKAWEFSRAANESERIFRDVATRRRRVDEQEQVDAYRRSEQTRYEIWNDMYRDYMAVRRAGASQGEAVRLMTDIGISKKEAIAISRGRYVPYEVSNEVLRRSKLNENKVPIKEIRVIGKEMPRVLTDIKKTP